MCLAIPGKILNIDDRRATVSILGVTREISIALIEDANPGEYVIVHAGCAISKIDEQEALETIKILRELEESTHE